ncbi:MAG: CBS domain-containing protein [Betaproteobacteria bacterium]
MSKSTTLPVTRLAGAVTVSRPSAPKLVTPDSPALDVMTDLNAIHAAVITPSSSLDSANAYMVQRSVRLLLVLSADRTLAGIITATDVLGEKPLRFVQERRVHHDELLVSDIMTPLAMIDAVSLPDLEHAKVKHVIALLRESGRLHTLVVEPGTAGTNVVRGILSISQIERQLGAKIQHTGAAHSFAEIEARIAST